MKVFISYSSKDIEFVRKLSSDLRNIGIEPWYSENDISVADSIIARMNEGLTSAKFVIAVLSEHSLASPWVTAEINLAIYEEIVNNKTFLIPIILDSCEIPPLLRTKKYVSFRNEYQNPFKELITFLLSKEINKMGNENNTGIPVTSSEEVNSIFRINSNHKLRAVPQKVNAMILESQCLRKGKFQLTSGSYSNYYIMPRKIFEGKKAKIFFIEYLANMLKRKGEEFNAIIFPALTDGGILGNLLAEKLDISKRIPVYMAHNKRDFSLESVDIAALTKQNCLYVDDVITSGKSIQIAINILLQYRITLSCVATLFCRNINTFNMLTSEFKQKKIRLISSFFAEVPPYEQTEMPEIKVEEIN